MADYIIIVGLGGPVFITPGSGPPPPPPPPPPIDPLQPIGISGMQLVKLPGNISCVPLMKAK